MIKILILAGVGYIAYRLLKSWVFQGNSSPNRVARQAAGQIDDIMIKDPFCETYFPKRDGVHLKYHGKELYFCSSDCRDKYVARQSNTDSPS